AESAAGYLGTVLFSAELLSRINRPALATMGGTPEVLSSGRNAGYLKRLKTWSAALVISPFWREETPQSGN
ncbi:MAG TPA: hypothetical protein DCX03_04370, partial [Bacteroidales bacterium]|nr:hypothetical protein [Bacteroidales bacterium]